MADVSESLKKSRVKTQFKTGAKQVEIARKGGIASGESKLHAKTLRKAMEAILANTYNDKSGQKLSGAEVLALNMFKIASSKDRNAVNAYRAVMETSGAHNAADDAITDETRKAIAELMDGLNKGNGNKDTE